ncbi:Unknown protein, partial [Striga hermonthica]
FVQPLELVVKVEARYHVFHYGTTQIERGARCGLGSCGPTSEVDPLFTVRMTITMEQIASIYIRGITRFHEVAETIVSDRNPHFIGSFEILDRVDEVVYRLALPPEFSVVRNVFHESMLRNYMHDPGH